MNKITKAILKKGHYPTATMRIDNNTSYVKCRYCDASAKLTATGIEGTLITTECSDPTSKFLALRALTKK